MPKTGMIDAADAAAKFGALNEQSNMGSGSNEDFSSFEGMDLSAILDPNRLLPTNDATGAKIVYKFEVKKVTSGKNENSGIPFINVQSECVSENGKGVMVTDRLFNSAKAAPRLRAFVETIGKSVGGRISNPSTWVGSTFGVNIKHGSYKNQEGEEVTVNNFGWDYFPAS